MDIRIMICDEILETKVRKSKFRILHAEPICFKKARNLKPASEIL